MGDICFLIKIYGYQWNTTFYFPGLFNLLQFKGKQGPVANGLLQCYNDHTTGDHELMLHFVRPCTKKACGSPDFLQIKIKNIINQVISNWCYLEEIHKAKVPGSHSLILPIEESLSADNFFLIIAGCPRTTDLSFYFSSLFYD